MTITYWCEHAWLGDPDGRVEHGVAIDTDDGTITGVRVGVSREGLTLPGLTLPGMANAHSHAFHRALRGRTHGETGSFWTWREQMYRLAERLDPDSYHRLATAVFAEMVQSGYTCVGEFHYLHHDRGGNAYADPNAMGEALIEAARTAGIRFTLLDACYLQADMSGAALQGTQRRFGDGGADGWIDRVDGIDHSRDIVVGAAIHSVRAVPASAISAVAAWADGRGAPLHAHVSEQPAENEQCLAAHGCTPVELLDRHGALRPALTAVHATHLTDGDVGLLGQSRATCCLCATTERDLADGIGPTAQLRDAGIAMSIGSDSHAMIDPFEETRAVELDERLASLQRGTHRAGELLAMATWRGYECLGWRGGGRIASGSPADLTTVALGSVRLAGTDPDDAVAAVVFAATASDVTDVVVAGRRVVSDGAHQHIDVAASLRRTIEEVWS